MEPAALSDSSIRPPKLDFRFAFDDDAEEIADLVNNKYKIEEEFPDGDVGPYVFRKHGIPRVTVDEVEGDLSRSGGVKWAVLETPRPEEAVVAAARIYFPSFADSRAVIDIFAAETNEQRDQLLVPQWRDDVQDWLSCCGYVDAGGHSWPEETSSTLLKHTMILEFQKIVTPNCSQADVVMQSSQCEICEDAALSVDDLTNALSSSSLMMHNRPGEQMESLISDLFAALHRDSSIFDREGVVVEELIR